MVIYSKKTRESARALKQKLEEMDYDGETINYGYSGSKREDVVNRPSALKNSVNKRIALEQLKKAGVPTLLIDNKDIEYPIVGRPDNHSMGRWMYICWDEEDYRRSKRKKRPATHYQKYLTGFREFRVHIVNGESIKISEKIGGGNYHQGAVFEYPHDFNHKKTLRKLARDAVEALGLDFGAVDILWKDEGYVLEVNSAPRLTDEATNTLERYAEAFVRNYD